VEQIHSELEVMKAQNKMVIQKTYMGYLNETYAKMGLSLLLPRRRTFSFNTDTGLGLFIGMGQYFGRNHVADLSLDWDIYPSLTVRYRYEFHQASPAITYGPVIGYKIKAASMKPLDNFIEDADSLKTSFFLLGMIVGIPMNRALVTMEFLFLTNQQSFLVMNTGIHLFL
jgi:hypothetical protein